MTVTAIELKKELATNHLATLKNYLGNESDSLKFMSSVMYVFWANPKLAQCTQESIVQSFMKCAELNIYPSSVSGEAYILPYGNMAQFQLGYKGIVKLMARSGIVIISSDIVKVNDPFDQNQGTNPYINHSVYTKGPRGEAIGVYVVAKFMGEIIFKFMNKDEVLEFKKFSKSKASESSPWDPKNDPELWMWRKTCLKQLSKMLPQNEQLAIAMAADDEEADIKEFQKEKVREQISQPGKSMEELLTNGAAIKQSGKEPEVSVTEPANENS